MRTVPLATAISTTHSRHNMRLKTLLTLLLLVISVSSAFAAFTANTAWETQNGGSDTANGGGFDFGQTAGMFTDGAATLATGTAPVFSSASYNFVAGDVGAWVFIGAGTNWIQGWYKIASVASNVATLNGTIGTAVTKLPLFNPSTVQGCASTASPTGATWSIDYSQQTSPKFTYTDLVSAGAGLTVTSVAHPFAKYQVGNCLVVTAGTNFNTGRYFIASISGVTATVIAASGNLTSGIGAAGVGSLGGCLVTPGQEGALLTISGMTGFVLYNVTDFTISTATPGAGGPCLFPNAVSGSMVGYTTVRGDNDIDHRPTLNWGAVAAPGALTYLYATQGNAAQTYLNLRANGNSVNNVGGFSLVASGQVVERSRAVLCNGTAGVGYGGTGALIALMHNSATTCTTGILLSGAGVQATDCRANACTNGFSITGGLASLNNCLTYGNTGDGMNEAGGSASYFACTSSGNTGDGFDVAGNRTVFSDCVSTFNGGFAYNATGATTMRLINCFDLTNTSGRTNSNAILSWMPMTNLSADPYIDKANADFRPNTTAGGGALLRAGNIGIPGQTNNQDAGAVQHADPAGGYSRSRVVNR